ncbi:MAG: hypothetical protein K6E85_10010 [Lachnospiraceae bacterium]|nr:hypothetical protein [Lachnospiraceae bacterium]
MGMKNTEMKATGKKVTEMKTTGTKIMEMKTTGMKAMEMGMMKRNRIEISVKGLILAVVVIIALVLSAISLYMVTRSRSTINDGNTQYSQLMSRYSEINATLYDGLYVSGEKVVDVIKDCAGDLKDGVVVITLMDADSATAADKNGQTYKTTNGYNVSNKSDKEYINPSGTFVGSVEKNANGMVTKITFTQKK